MAKPIIVNFEHTDYTWDGERWYRTADHMMPIQGIIRKLNLLLPKKPEKAKPASSTRA